MASKVSRDKAKLTRAHKSGKNQSSSKHFSEEEKALYNDPALTVVMEYLDREGIWAQRNEDKYGPDIVAFKGFSPAYYVEPEVKNNWRAGQSDFPFPTVNIPERKKKFTDLLLPCEFWVLRQDLLFAVIVPGSTISLKFLREVPNRYCASGEMFYQVPLEECNVIDLREPHEEEE